MADEPDKQDETAEETSAPEVEAELVDETAPDEETAAFDAAPGQAQAGSPQGVKTLTPGVWLFIGFVVVALGLFALWRFSSGGTDKVSDAGVEAILDAGTVESENAGETSDTAEAPADGSVDEPTADLEEVVTEDASKVLNDAVVDAAGAIKKETQEAASDSEGYLSPAAGEPAGSNAADITTDQSFREAAKQAANDFAAAPEELAEASDDEAAITGFEREEEALADAGLTADEAGAVIAASPPAAHSGPAPGLSADPDLTAKIRNDVAALKEAFREQTDGLARALEDERERSATLEDEIRSMREDFAAAIAARDERAAAELSDMRDQLNKIRNDETAAPGKLAVGAAAFQVLRRAVEEGEPFASELRALSNLVPDAAPLAALQPYAAIGAPKTMALKEGFGPAARAGLAAAGQANAKNGFQRLVARLQSLVAVRPARPQAGDSARAVMSRAEGDVLSGDFAGALAELDALPPLAQEAMSGWMNDARARAEIDAALMALDAYFLDGSAG